MQIGNLLKTLLIDLLQSQWMEQEELFKEDNECECGFELQPWIFLGDPNEDEKRLRLLFIVVF